MARQPALRGVGQEPGDQLDRPQAGQRAGLDEALLGQRDPVVDEIPVGAADQPDVRLEDDHPTAGPEQPVGDGELLDDRRRALEVLEVVAHEDRSEARRRHRAVELETARLDEPDVGRELGSQVAQVGRPALGRVDVADEVAGVAGDVEDGRRRIDPALEEADDLRPDQVLLAARCLGEARR